MAVSHRWHLPRGQDVVGNSLFPAYRRGPFRVLCSRHLLLYVAQAEVDWEKRVFRIVRQVRFLRFDCGH